jgi:trimeric autotransporter adhesin
MKPKLLLFSFFILFFLLSPCTAQIPQGFNYQAIARDGSGNPIINATIKVKLSILSDTTGFYLSGLGTYLWEEEQTNVKTNSFGMFTLVFGNPSATKIQGSAASFSAVPWSATPLYTGTKIANPTTYKNMGSAKLWSVPYSMVTGTLLPLNKLVVKGNVPSMDSALFEVKNNNGQTVFAVYNEGIRAYVDDGKVKGATKGGFAIGGFGTVKSPSQNLMMISPDSARIYIDKTAAKGTKGGFAIGGFSTVKGTVDNFIKLTPNNYFIGEKSGHLITDSGIDTLGTYNSTMGFESGMNLVEGSDNVFMGYQSGWKTKEGSDNVFLGTAAGYGNTIGGANIFIGTAAGYENVSGFNNVMMGTWAGVTNTDGYANIFIGSGAGYSNTHGYSNVFIGDWAGYSNDGGADNVFMGSGAGSLNSDGADNVFIGSQAGYLNSSGLDNVFIGKEAGNQNTEGATNVFIGSQAGYQNSMGQCNVLIGKSAGHQNTSGWYNISIGRETGYNTTAGQNIFIGDQTAQDNSSGNQNVMIGDWAGRLNTLGAQNVFLGASAGYENDEGEFNTYVGYHAGKSNTGSRNVFVGNYAGSGEVGNNDKLIISNAYNGADNINNALIYGDFAAKTLKINGSISSVDVVIISDNPALEGVHNVSAEWGIGVKGTGGYYGVLGESTYPGTGSRYGVYGNATGGSVNYGVYGQATGGTSYAGYFSGDLYYSGALLHSSDKNLKKNISPMTDALRKVLELQGVTYEWKSDAELLSSNFRKTGGKKGTESKSFNLPAGTQIGVLAQDVEKVLPELVQTDGDGLKSVDYIKLIPLLIEAIKEQQKQIDALTAKNAGK